MTQTTPVPRMEPAAFAAKESLDARQQRVAAVYEILKPLHPAKFELNAKNAFELLVATMLAARSRDVVVNKLTPAIFAKYPDPAAMAMATPADLEPLVQGVTSQKKKTEYLVNTAKMIVQKHGGDVPADLDALVKFPGVGRKTAIAVMGACFGKQVGISVDTHVNRVSTRMAWAVTDDTDESERLLKPLVPQEEWTAWTQRVVLHGRYTCTAKDPKCGECPVAQFCPSRAADA